MRRLIFLILLTLAITSAHATEIPFKIKPKHPKISTKFDKKLTTASSDEKFKVWVFFTDKGIHDDASLKEAIDQLPSRFSERSVARRHNRTDKTRIFDFYDIPVSPDYVDLIESAGLEVARRSRWLNAISAHANNELIWDISEFPFVSEIRPVAMAIRKPLPYDPDIIRESLLDSIYKQPDDIPDSLEDLYGQSYTQLKQINVPLMHQLGYIGSEVLIALFDTGFDLDHPVFDSLKLYDKYDFINNDTSVGDTTEGYWQPSHGTGTLSVIGGRADSSLLGAAHGADYMLAKTEISGSVEIRAEEDNWVAAAEWADSTGANIISSSLGYYDWYEYSDLDGHTAAITIAAEVAVSKGIAVFNSAGNERSKPWHYIIPPADGPSVMAIGAINSLGEIAWFSSAGPTYDGRIKPDLVAMGVGVYKANYGSSPFGTGNGTSYSCPLAAGAAALLLEANPNWSPLELKEAMIGSANRFDNPDTLYGYGLFDTYRAADLLKINPLDPIFLAVGDSLNLDIGVSGMEDADIIITASNLPATAIFTDLGNRTAILRYAGKNEDLGTMQIHIMASAGLATASLDVSLAVLARHEISAGPNPFSDSLTIFLGTDPGALEEIAIYTVNGEKVWDNYTDSYSERDRTVVWKGINNAGSKVAPGIYLVLVRTENSVGKIKLFRR